MLSYSDKFVCIKSSNRVQKCQICPYFTTLQFFMVNHARRHHAPPVPFSCENPVQIYNCDDCKFQTPLTIDLKRHIENFHNRNLPIIDYNIPTYVCKKCNFESHFSITWLRHTIECEANVQLVEKSHPLTEHKLKTPTDKTQLKRRLCSQCSFQGKNSVALRNHRRNVHSTNVKWYQCEQCPHKTKYPRHLKQHVLNVHGAIKRVNCDQCPHVAKNKDSLRMHVLRFHSNRGYYECDYCAYKSRHPNNIKTHMMSKHLIGSELEWQQCEKCPFKTKLKHYLKRHQKRTHFTDNDIERIRTVMST